MTENLDLLTDTHQQAWARIMRASGRIMLAVETALKKAGHPPLAWYDLLLELKRVHPEGLRPYQLQSRMLVQQYNMSRLIERMVKNGLVQRQSCEDDGRGHIIYITESGLQLQQAIWPVYRQVLAQEVGMNLDEEAAANLIDLLAPLMPGS